MSYRTVVITFVVAALWLYGLAAFINVSWDASTWPRDARSGAAILHLAAWAALLSFSHMREKP